MKGVQCYELFGGIALKIHTFSFLQLRFSLYFLRILLFIMTSEQLFVFEHVVESKERFVE